MPGGAGQPAHDVRGDDAHETERTAEGRRRSGQQAGGNHGPGPDTPDGRPGQGRIILSEKQQVQTLGADQRQDQTQNQSNSQQQDLSNPPAGKTAR